MKSNSRVYLSPLTTAVTCTWFSCTCQHCSHCSSLPDLHPVICAIQSVPHAENLPVTASVTAPAQSCIFRIHNAEPSIFRSRHAVQPIITMHMQVHAKPPLAARIHHASQRPVMHAEAPNSRHSSSCIPERHVHLLNVHNTTS